MVLLLAMLMRGAVAGYVIPVQMDHLPGTVLSMPAESCHDAEGLLPAGDSQKNMTSCQIACDLAFAPALAPALTRLASLAPTVRVPAIPWLAIAVPEPPEHRPPIL